MLLNGYFLIIWSFYFSGIGGYLLQKWYFSIFKPTLLMNIHFCLHGKECFEADGFMLLFKNNSGLCVYWVGVPYYSNKMLTPLNQHWISGLVNTEKRELRKKKWKCYSWTLAHSPLLFLVIISESYTRRTHCTRL